MNQYTAPMAKSVEIELVNVLMASTEISCPNELVPTPRNSNEEGAQTIDPQSLV